MLTSTTPSEWARSLVRGAYDLHVHVAPDVMPRRVTYAALEAGVRHVIVTHPDAPQQDLPLDDQLALARMGAFLERCFATPFTGNCDWATMLAGIRATGPGRTIVVTDLGQPGNPPVGDGLALMAGARHAAGFTDGEITTMIVDNSRLARADPLPPGGAP